jgi:signal transduction histidine kinase
MEKAQTLNVAIVGGGPGCKAIMDMIFAEKLRQLHMKLIGVASTNPKAVGYRYAQEKDVYTTRDYRDLYKLQDIDMIIELTGRDRVVNEILRSKPDHVRLMDHIAARLFWDVFEIEEERLAERNLVEERFLRYQKKLRSLASALSLAEEQERRRIATEVHEHIGQNLAFAKIKLGTARELAASPSLRGAVDEVIEVVDEAIKATRSLVSQVSSPVLYQLGFVAAIEWLTQEMQKQHGITVDFEDDGEPKPLSNDVSVLLFQAVRELLANVVRHAQARTTKVFIARSGDEIRVDVTDDGVGFDPAEMERGTDKGDRFGLFSIRERLEPLGGQMKVASKLGQGTQVALVGPLKSEV